VGKKMGYSVFKKKKQCFKHSTPRNCKKKSMHKTKRKMFYVLSLNPKKHTVRIVGHASSLEEAINLVSEHADQYVKSKNGPVMHRGEAEVKLTDRVFFFTKKVPQQDYQIDVFRQQTHEVRTWTGVTYKDEQSLVRRFCYAEYDGCVAMAGASTGELLLPAPEPIPLAPLPPLVFDTSTAPPKAKFFRPNTLAGFPQDVIESLRQNERFQQYRITADLNHLPPPFQRTVFPAADDGTSDSFEDE
jgi:hypothetical protein